MAGKMARAAEMRANGDSFETISETLGIHIQTARKAGAGIEVGQADTRSTIVRNFPRNGGCSTCSGMVPVTLPRIPVLHGHAA